MENPISFLYFTRGFTLLASRAYSSPTQLQPRPPPPPAWPPLTHLGLSVMLFLVAKSEQAKLNF